MTTEPTNQNQAKAVLDAWEVFLRYRWRFIVPTVLVMAAVLIVGLMIPRKYKATATFERRTDMVLTEIAKRGATRKFEDPRNMLRNELVSLPALREALDGVDPQVLRKTIGNNRLAREALLGEMKREIVVSYDVSSAEMDRVRVEYTTEYPDLGKHVVDALINNYIAERRAAMETRLSESAQFFRGKVTSHRNLIEQMENQKLSFEIKHGELLPDSPNSVQNMLAMKQATLARLKQEHDTARMRVESLMSALDQTPKTTPSVRRGKNPELTTLEKQLRDLEMELAKYTGIYKMKATHPDVISVKQEIASVRKTMAQTDSEVVTERETSANPRYTEIDLLLTDARTQQQALSKQVAAVETEIQNLNKNAAQLFPVRSEYRKLSRQVSETERQLSFWEENLRRVELALAAENGNRGVQLEFIEPSHVAGRPVSPDLGQVLTAALALGLVSGTVSLFFAHRTDETFTDGKQMAEAFELPLFGGVSEIISHRQRRMRRLRNMVIYPVNAVAIAALLLGLSTILYMDIEHPGSLQALTKATTEATDTVTPQAVTE